MVSRQPRWCLLLEELQSAILAPDEILPNELEQVSSQVGRVVEAIRLRRHEPYKSTRAALKEPNSHDKPRRNIQPRRDIEPGEVVRDDETTRNDGPEIGVAAKILELRSEDDLTVDPAATPGNSNSSDGRCDSQAGRDLEITAAARPKVGTVDEVINALEKNRSDIEDHAKLLPEEQIEFDWDQDDVRLPHILCKSQNRNDLHLRSLACWSVARELVEWSASGEISKAQLGRQAKKHGISNFIASRFKVMDRDRKRFANFISVGRKMLQLESKLGCVGSPAIIVSAIVVFAWKPFRNMSLDAMGELCSRLQGHWGLRLTHEHRQRSAEAAALYEGMLLLAPTRITEQNLTFAPGKRQTRKRQFGNLSHDESFANKRPRLGGITGNELRMETHAAPTNSSRTESVWSGCRSNTDDTQQTSEQDASAAISRPDRAITRSSDRERSIHPTGCTSLTTTCHGRASAMQMVRTGWSDESHEAWPTSISESMMDTNWQQVAAPFPGTYGSTTCQTNRDAHAFPQSAPEFDSQAPPVFWDRLCWQADPFPETFWGGMLYTDQVSM